MPALDLLEGITTPSTQIVRRKRFTLHERDPIPIITLSPVVEEEEEHLFEDDVITTYPVLIGIALLLGNLLDSDSEDLMLTYRENIKRVARQINVVAPGIPIVGVSIDLSPPFDRSGARDDLDMSALTVRYEVDEPRSIQ